MSDAKKLALVSLAAFMCYVVVLLVYDNWLGFAALLGSCAVILLYSAHLKQQRNERK